MVQRNAMKVWAGIQGQGSRVRGLKETLLKDKEVIKYLSKKEISDLFDIAYHLKNVDYIFKRVFGNKREYPFSC